MNMNGFYDKIDSLFAGKDFQGAESFMKEALAQAEFEDDPSATVTICNELGGFYRAFSRYSEGIPLYEKALGCIRRLGMENSEGHGTTLLNFATTLAIVGESDRALGAYQQAAGIFEGPSYAKDFRLAKTTLLSISGTRHRKVWMRQTRRWMNRSACLKKNWRSSNDRRTF